MDQQLRAKWEWTVTAPLKLTTADQIWHFLVDFFNIFKWFPGLPTSYGVHGNNGEVGCIRYCSGCSIPTVDGSTSWSTERLTAVDPEEKMIRYEIVGCNIGFESYVSTIKICPGNGDGGCEMWWSVTVDPIRGWKVEEIMGVYEVCLRAMAKKMEDDSLGRS